MSAVNGNNNRANISVCLPYYTKNYGEPGFRLESANSLVSKRTFRSPTLGAKTSIVNKTKKKHVMKSVYVPSSCRKYHDITVCHDWRNDEPHDITVRHDYTKDNRDVHRELDRTQKHILQSGPFLPDALDTPKMSNRRKRAKPVAVFVPAQFEDDDQSEHQLHLPA